jgi:hypothetical protein
MDSVGFVDEQFGAVGPAIR